MYFAFLFISYNKIEVYDRPIVKQKMVITLMLDIGLKITAMAVVITRVLV
jgi:hypothetical protein